MKKVVCSIVVSIILISCGGKTSSDSSDAQSPTVVSKGELNPVPDELQKYSFVLNSSSKSHKNQLKAVFYDKDKKVIKISDQVKSDEPGYFPVGATEVKIFGVKGTNLEKARIFSCCGMAQDTVVTRNEDGVWTVNGFFIHADSKIPPIFTIDGVDHYLPTNLKKGLVGLRNEFKSMVDSMGQTLNLSQDQQELLKVEVNKILKKNLLSEMN